MSFDGPNSKSRAPQDRNPVHLATQVDNYTKKAIDFVKSITVFTIFTSKPSHIYQGTPNSMGIIGRKPDMYTKLSLGPGTDFWR